MTTKATVYHVLVASPSDVQDERDAACEAMYAWNADHAADKGILKWTPKTGQPDKV